MPPVLCSQCENNCDRALVNGVIHEVKICNCGLLFCGLCGDSKKCDCSPLEHRLQPRLLLKLCTFANTAPDDQLDLIDMQLSRPANCPVCETSHYERFRGEIQQVMCKRCLDPWDDYRRVWSTSSSTELYFSQLIDRTIRKSKSPSFGTSGTLPVRLRSMYCNLCEKHIPSNPFIMDRDFYCHKCATERFGDIPGFECCLCVSKFTDCIECIPENQLHLLTYSKWVKAVGCEIHENVLNELIAVSADGLRKGKLRSFFKDDDIANEKLVNVGSESNQRSTPVPVVSSTSTTSTNGTDMKQLASKLSTVDISTSLTMKLIVCPCGRDDATSNVFICNNCSVYGLCSLCIIRNHLGHQFQESAQMVNISAVNAQSERILHKLSQWSGQAKELNVESEKAFKKLCTTLGNTFVEAINSEDHHRIQALLEKTDTSTLGKHFKDTVNSTRKLHKAIDYFCEDLTEVHEGGEETIDTSVQETSGVDCEGL